MVMVESNQIVVDNVSSSSRFEAFCNEYKQCYLLTYVGYKQRNACGRLLMYVCRLINMAFGLPHPGILVGKSGTGMFGYCGTAYCDKPVNQRYPKLYTLKSSVTVTFPYCDYFFLSQQCSVTKTEHLCSIE